jgi:hypothetical protein
MEKMKYLNYTLIGIAGIAYVCICVDFVLNADVTYKDEEVPLFWKIACAPLAPILLVFAHIALFFSKFF